MLSNSNSDITQNCEYDERANANQSIKVDCAIFSAMPEELAYFEEAFHKSPFQSSNIHGFEIKIYEYLNRKILIAHTGLGTTFAASIMTLIQHHYNPGYILIAGTAGEIDPKLKLCDVVIAAKSFEAEIQGAFQLLPNTPFESCLTHPLRNQTFPKIYSADDELLQIAETISLDGINIHVGTVVSSNAFPAPRELFEKIKSENPYSIDMETSAFYQVAWLLNSRVIAVRGISNLLNSDGTDENVHKSDVKGSAEAAAKVLHKILITLLNKLTPTTNIEKNLCDEYINKLKLKPHPEGGHYARVYESGDFINSTDSTRYNGEERRAGTAIYYLLQKSDFSAWHSLKSDELWHFYEGSPIKIYVIDKEGQLKMHLLGNAGATPGATFQIAIPAGQWFAAELSDKTSFSLVGCTVNPGFEFKDFILADANELINLYPQHEFLIRRLSRDIPKESAEEKCVGYLVL